MGLISTGYGFIRVPDDVPPELACARCGVCCRAFFLSITDETLREWAARRRAGETHGLPPDLDAVLELFIPLSQPPPTSEGSWYTCRAFDAERNLCRLMETDPSRRPQACYAYPYLFDWASLHEAPYPNCRIVNQAVRHLNGKLAAHLAAWIGRATGLGEWLNPGIIAA